MALDSIHIYVHIEMAIDDPRSFSLVVHYIQVRRVGCAA